ncbi:hypothetical protein FRB97_001440 [Tulasnella sp. 331]|nr:hypothetical protein FRB97_001440 [Tulasnella sp. 331]
MAPAAPPPAKRALPTKENTVFKSLLQLYESRQYKKALKAADQILKKVPEHGETTSMKGLVLTNMDRKEEGIDLVKKGVRLDITSHICWHVYGIVHKSDRNYEEALKCYRKALQYDKDNVNIIRDSAQLQLQLRHYDGLRETRLALLKLRPFVRTGWIGLAVAYRLNGNLQGARQVLKQYISSLKDVPNYDLEYSELMLYYIRLLEDLQEYSEAMQLLDVHAKGRSIVDKTAITLLRGESREKAMQLLQQLAADLPRANAPKRLPLTICTCEAFRPLVEPYLLSGLSRGIPSLFADVKSLYVDLEKRQMIEEYVTNLCVSLTGPTTSGERTGPEPSTYIWSLYFLAQHHSYISPTKPQKALEYIDLALAHTPTLPELYMIKARALKRAGDPIGASRAMEDARRLDKQDRFINTKTAKYLLRDGQVEGASTILGLFTKESQKDAASPGSDLEEMQSLLYMLEEGDAFRRMGKLSMALKRYKGIEKAFAEFEDDQFDFHSYCLRRHTLTAYETYVTDLPLMSCDDLTQPFSLLRWEDNAKSHPAYVSSALSAARIYIRIYDDPALIVASAPASLTDTQKKARKKAKKAEKKAETPMLAPTDDKDSPPAPAKDEDPDGMKLLSVVDPLEQAMRLVKPLEDLQASDIRIWLIAYDISLRRKKYLQALKALKAACELDKNSSELHYRVIEFKSTVDSSQLSADMKGSIDEVLPLLVPSGLSLEQFNNDFVQRNSGSAAAQLGYSRALWIMYKDSEKRRAEDALASLSREDVDTSIQIGLDALAFLRDVVRSPQVDNLRTALAQRFPASTIFKAESEREQLRADHTRAAATEEEKAEELI